MIATEVQVRSSDGALLAGTLALPERAARSVVLKIHGTGPLDRNENASQKQGQRLDVFNALARDLAAAGDASLRYDKRGCGASGSSYLHHSQADLIDDARAWVEDLKARGIGPVVLLGHSEGTIIAPRVAEGRDDVAGIVLICPFLQPIETLLRRQAAQLAQEARAAKGVAGALQRAILWLIGGFERSQDRLIQRIRSSDAPVIRAMGQRVPAQSLRDLLALDPREVHGRNALPTLVFVAGKDLQCPPEDGAALAALNPKAALVVVEDLTHILRRDAGVASMAGYAVQLHAPIDPVVAATVCNWLDQRIC
jgi:uncharacterized protein